MKYLITTDTDGRCLGLYLEGVSRDIPQSAIEIQDDDADQMLMASHLGDFVLVDGRIQVDAVYVEARNIQRLTKELTDAIQTHLDATVRSRGYDSVVSCASYAASTNPIFSTEAQAAIAWRDTVWSYFYAELEKVQVGARTMPSDSQSFITELPSISW